MTDIRKHWDQCWVESNIGKKGTPAIILSGQIFRLLFLKWNFDTFSKH